MRGSGNEKILGTPVLQNAGEVRSARIPRSWGYGGTGNSKHDFWHSVCSSDHWTLETGAETLWKAIRAPIQTKGFCQCQKEKNSWWGYQPREFHSVALLQYYARNAFNDGVLPFITCHFVFGREEVTKRSYFYLFYFIYLRPAFIKHGTEITLDFPSVFFYCFFM